MEVDKENLNSTNLNQSLNSSNFISEINTEKWNNLTEKIETSTLDDLGKMNQYLIEIVKKYLVDVAARVVKVIFRKFENLEIFSKISKATKSSLKIF